MADDSNRPSRWRGRMGQMRTPLEVSRSVLEILALGSILIGVYSFMTGEAAREQRKQRHYQAWQVINSAQGKGGSGGRIDALEDLVQDGVSLNGVDLTGAWLANVWIPEARIDQTVLDSALLMAANLSGAKLRWASLRGVDATAANLSGANLEQADLTGADLFQASLPSANLRGASVSHLDRWQGIGNLESANLYGLRNPPQGFLSWAVHQKGAVCVSGINLWTAIVRDGHPAPAHPTDEAELAEYCNVTYTDDEEGGESTEG